MYSHRWNLSLYCWIVYFSAEALSAVAVDARLLVISTWTVVRGLLEYLSAGPGALT